MSAIGTSAPRPSRSAAGAHPDPSTTATACRSRPVVALIASAAARAVSKLDAVATGVRTPSSLVTRVIVLPCGSVKRDVRPLYGPSADRTVGTTQHDITGRALAAPP